jgi:mono/diheme cytochrome c family protein
MTPKTLLATVGGLCLWAGTLAARQAPAPAAPPAAQGMVNAQSAEFFESRVRPILVANCYDCHTDDEKGGLRVDSREALVKGGDSGPAITPGKPDESLLVQAIRHAASAPKMPKGRGQLKPEDIDALVAWIKADAPWPTATTSTPNGAGAGAGAAAGAVASATPTSTPAPVASHAPKFTAEQRAFWSFQPIHHSPVPAVRDAAWPKGDIDRFVLARLEHEGMRPVAAASKLALLRRATLDLTGLPPTPEDVDAFLKDTTPGAFAKVVDRLLASPQYGEAWGRLWLDVARYGEDDYRSLDPKGRGNNPYPNAYLYRDWVIKAFNDDMPYGQFVTAQLAADLGDDSAARLRNLPALGFLGLGPWYYDNGAVEVTHADERHDRVDAVSRGFLGLTVACARCHDHKYDPIPTRDYYALAGVFLNTEYHEYPLAPKSVVDDYKALEKKIEKKSGLLGEFLNNESQQLAQTLVFQTSKYMQAVWRVTGEPKADKNQVIQSGKLDFELFDRWMRFLSKPPANYPYLKPWQEMVTRGGTSDEAKRLGDDFQKTIVDVVIARKAMIAENNIIIAKALPTTKPRERANAPNEFKTNDDFCPNCGLVLKTLPIDQTNLYSDVFEFDLEVTAPGAPGKPALLSFNGWGLERQLGPDRQALVQALRDDIDAMQKSLPEQYPYVHGVQDVEKPVDLKIALRGSPYRSGEEVPRGFPSILSGDEPITFTKGSGRQELARLIVEQPIAMRVIVNRIWKGHFGSGLVDTPSNFGVNGERPTHPELLDYLAQYFVDHGMSIKALHREIMLSATYQLGDADSKAEFDKDSGNRLYWRANRHRLTAEQIRDAVLSVSGALDTKMGGPSATLTPLSTRRTIYGRVSRYKLDDFLQLFDYPSPMQSAEKRFSTNVPLQRLFFMNSDFIQQHAEQLAEKVIAEPTDEARIQKVYRMVFGRAATPAELQAGRDFLTTEPMKQYEDRKAAEAKAKADAEAAAKSGKPATAGGGSSPGGPPPATAMMAGVVPGAGDPKENEKKLPVTTFGRYIKVLLSSNEFLFVS